MWDGAQGKNTIVTLSRDVSANNNRDLKTSSIFGRISISHYEAVGAMRTKALEEGLNI